MNHVLSQTNVELLAQFAWSNVLLAFDFDGTLAPIVADRDEARVRTRTQQLLERVCRLYPCAIISGRSRDDVKRRLSGLRLRQIVGNHGLEPGAGEPAFARQVAAVRPQLERALRRHPGVDIEDKRFSLAIHYRRSRRKRDARRAIHEAVAELAPTMRITPGKLVVNVLPARAPHKGDALLRLRASEGADTAVYVGDDVTDEDVFQIDQPGRLLSIRVGRSQSTSAGYYLRDQREVDRLLAVLAKLRARERKT
jgi:trehalose 6-phosphate phosphatase